MLDKLRFLMVFIALPVILLAGCSTPQSIPLSVENRSPIKNIHLEKNVSKPSAIYWRGTTQAWGGALFGALGAFATADAGMTDAEKMIKFMEKNKIDISEIVYSEVSKQTAALKTYQISSVDKSDATLTFAVDMYGFNKTHPFGTHMNPMIRMTAKLIKPNNEIIWQESEFVSDFASENDQGQSLETYQNEPATLKAALAKASQVTVKRLLVKLQ
ncbi:conserved hypothetical protein [Limnobacter sp. 130]|uniref:hypothetical protein n=1 Tax=Limnobacter sp. 130 TaxID=2653147 RepID=UPI0012F389CC|nr:hypothetical protein [Limnobacter sp. 130]VWX33618.1 conserved hypothetical protein [Limnobacter sp. 130]